MKIEIDRIIEKAIKKYSPKARGILLFGSTARGGFDKFSDIDIYVLYRSKPKFTRENLTLAGVRIDVIIDSVADAHEFLKKENGSVRRNFAHMLAYGRIIYSVGDEIGLLQKMAINILEGKTRSSRATILMHLYSIEDFYGEVLRFAIKKDDLAFEQNCNLLMNNIIECFLRLKKEYFRRPNELFEIFLAKDKKFAKLISNYYKEKSMQSRSRILGELVSHIQKLAGGPLPSFWKIK